MQKYGIHFFLVCLLSFVYQFAFGDAGKTILDGTTLPPDPRRLVSPTRRLTSNTTLPDLYEASIAELQSGLEQGLFTSVDLVTVRPLLLCEWSSDSRECQRHTSRG